jgi:hypothetical protein
MISIWWLLLIVPVCSILGFMICAILASGRIADLENLLIVTNTELGKLLENKDGSN